MGGKSERVGVKAARGEFNLVEPIDTMLLGLLPEEGELFAGMYPLGETVENLSKKLGGKDKAPSSTVASRLRALSLQGLTVKANSVARAGGRTVWQRTEVATTLLKTKGIKSNGSSTG